VSSYVVFVQVSSFILRCAAVVHAALRRALINPASC